MVSKEKWKFYDDVFTPLVCKQIYKITGGCLWYEVWIDFEEEVLQAFNETKDFIESIESL